jgi:NAD-reducing hydrogenase large subunit
MSKKITISPVTRIEGHAKVTVYLDDDGRVERTYFHVDQFRGYEKFSEGRFFAEMPVITPRICGICPVSHHLAAAKACDEILGVNIPGPAKLLRELIHMGQVIQSHAMHFFELAGPDIMLGWDSDPALRNVVGLVKANPELALKAVRLRKYGQTIIETVAGRRIHPTFAIPGGVNTGLTAERRDGLLKGVDDYIAHLMEGVAIIRDFITTHKEESDNFASFPSGYMGMVSENGALELYDGVVRMMDKNGTVIDEFPPKYYLSHIGELVDDWSYLKFPFFKPLGEKEGFYRVGPLARLNASDRISTPTAQEEFLRFREMNHGKPAESSFYYHYARLIEAVYAVERARQILEDPDVLSTDLLHEGPVQCGEGVGALEAPRGTLFHQYWVNEDGMMTKANLIVASGHNNWAMSKAVDCIARSYITGSDVPEGVLNRIEGAIRCYDPCLSCSTHAVGKMPMVVEIFDHAGNLIDVRKRS